MKWWDKKEKSNKFFLKISVFLSKYCPYFLLKIIVFFIAFFFFIFAKNERKFIRAFFKKINECCGSKKKLSVFLNFYNFSISIADKFAILQDKKFNLLIENKDLIERNLLNQKRGSIILISHFGNSEIARCFSENYLKTHILLYSKHASVYIDTINEISKNKINYIEVSSIDINSIIKLSEVIEKGEHIVIMGDRPSINDARNTKIEFLGKKTLFAEGGFLLAYLLKTKINSMWCVKKNNDYLVSSNVIVEGIKSKAEINIYMKKYINELENMVKKYPNMWFNFYDYWGEYEENLQN